MPFSLRLTADLAFAFATRAIRLSGNRPAIISFSPEIELAAASDGTQAAGILDLDSISSVSRYVAPIVWIRGTEPLDHAGVPALCNALVASKRQAFLETSGSLLKARVHELRPSSRLHVMVRFDCRDAAGDRASCADSEIVAMEALRFARLAGFFTCANVVLHDRLASARAEGLAAGVRELDVDGLVITAGAPDLTQTVSELRKRLSSVRWSLLARMLDSARPMPGRETAEEDDGLRRESEQKGFAEEAEAG